MPANRIISIIWRTNDPPGTGHTWPGVRKTEKDQTQLSRPEDLLAWALEKNAAARAVYLAMDDAGREKLRRQAEKIGDQRAMDDLVDSFAGWQRGHPPCQL